ncbi:MAG: hypothetical protein AAF960_27005 [Bacteroidota bacterium]
MERLESGANKASPSSYSPQLERITHKIQDNTYLQLLLSLFEYFMESFATHWTLTVKYSGKIDKRRTA